VLEIHEHRFSVLCVARIAIKDETFVHAGRRGEVLFHDLLKNFVRQSDIDLGPVEVGILLLACLFVGRNFCIFQLLDGFLDKVSERVVFARCVFDHVGDHQVRNAVARCQLLRVVRLAGCWRTPDVNFQREEAAEEIELVVQLLHGCIADALAAVPLGGQVQEFLRRLELEIERQRFRPVFVNDLVEADRLERA